MTEMKVTVKSNLKELADDINRELMDWLEESGQEMAEELNRDDSLNVAHDTFIAQRRRTAVAVGPSNAGGRAHIVRFHEFGVAHHKATPLIRPLADKYDRPMKTKLTRAVKRTIEARRIVGS